MLSPRACVLSSEGQACGSAAVIPEGSSHVNVQSRPCSVPPHWFFLQVPRCPGQNTALLGRPTPHLPPARPLRSEEAQGLACAQPLPPALPPRLLQEPPHWPCGRPPPPPAVPAAPRLPAPIPGPPPPCIPSRPCSSLSWPPLSLVPMLLPTPGLARMSCGHSPPASSSPPLLAWGHSPLTCSRLGPMFHPASRHPSAAVTVGALVPRAAHSHLVCWAGKDRELAERE